MAIHVITESEYEDFMNEPDTEPFLKVVEDQLNGATSMTQFLGQAQALGYSVDPPEKWGKLEVEMEGALVQVDAITISFLVETA